MESVAGLSDQDPGFGLLCWRSSVRQTRTSSRIYIDIMRDTLGAQVIVSDAVHSLIGSEW